MINTDENCSDCLLQDTRISPGGRLSNSRTMYPRGKLFPLERRRLFYSTSLVYPGTYPSYNALLWRTSRSDHTQLRGTNKSIGIIARSVARAGPAEPYHNLWIRLAGDAAAIIFTKGVFNSQENSHFTAAAYWCETPIYYAGICTPQRGCCSR